MFRLIRHQSSWLSFLKALPVFPLGFIDPIKSATVPATASVSVTSDVDVESGAVQAGGGGHAVDGDNGVEGSELDGALPESPLTFGKVFLAIPRMTKAINTPVINTRIAEVFGLPPLKSSSEFKTIYSEGREVLR